MSFAVVPLVAFTSSRRKMGQFVNSGLTQVLAWTTAALIVTLNLKYLSDYFGLSDRLAALW